MSLHNTGVTPDPDFYFPIKKLTTRGAFSYHARYPHGLWGVPTTAVPPGKHDPPPRGAALWCQGPTTDGATRFLILNFAQKDPGTRALAFMHPWKEHSFLRRGSWHTQHICDSSMFPRPMRTFPFDLTCLICSREEERWQGRNDQLRANALRKSHHAGPWANGNRKKHLLHSFLTQVLFL
jgi:hypothetical protein